MPAFYSPKTHSHFQQQGAALLMLVLVVVVLGSGILLTALNASGRASSLSHDKAVLKQAKQALLGYALSYADNHPGQLPGYLPCPDSNGDGLSDEPCGKIQQSALGRLPWRTLGLPPLRDSGGECLWYAVSGAYKASPKGRLSTDANGQFLVFDTQLRSLQTEPAIALVFAPGKMIASQRRDRTAGQTSECGSLVRSDQVNRAANFLDNFAGIDNASGRYRGGQILGFPIKPVSSSGFSAFVSAGTQKQQDVEVFNDQLIAIVPNDFSAVYAYMQRRVGETVRQCLKAYDQANAAKLPWPAILNGSTSPGYDDNTGQYRFGRIPRNLSHTAAAGMQAFWPLDPQQSGTQCFTWPWWQNMRETVFYAIDVSAAPTASSGQTVTVDGSPVSAAVLVAGRPGPGQRRLRNRDKGLIRQYLEGGNVVDNGSGRLPPGDAHFVSHDASVQFFNDYVCSLEVCP